jgi:hypothetical protein
MVSSNKSLLLIVTLFRHCVGQRITTPPAGAVTSVINGQTVAQTYSATSFSALSTVSSETSIETTIAGVVFVGSVFAGGLAWIIPKPPPGNPVVNPPNTPPVETPEPTNPPEPSKITTATPTPSKPADRGVQQAFVLALPAGFPVFQDPITVPDDQLTCGFNDATKVSVSRDAANTIIQKFCTDNANKPLTGDPLTISQTDGRLQSGQYLEVSMALDQACKDVTDETLDVDTCTSFLLETLDGCDTGSTTAKFGGTVNDECMTYVVHPTQSLGNLTCKADADQKGVGVDRDSVYANAVDFCNTINGKAVSPGAGFRQEYWETSGDSTVLLQVQYDSASCARGAGAVRAIDPDACKGFFTRLIDDCNTNAKAPFGKYGGTLTDECEVYSMDTIVVEQITCNDPPIFAGTPHAIPQDVGQKAIDQFCSAANISPIDLQSQSFTQFSPGVGNYNTGLDGWVIRVSVPFYTCASKSCFHSLTCHFVWTTSIADLKKAPSIENAHILIPC